MTANTGQGPQTAALISLLEGGFDAPEEMWKGKCSGSSFSCWYRSPSSARTRLCRNGQRQQLTESVCKGLRRLQTSWNNHGAHSCSGQSEAKPRQYGEYAKHLCPEGKSPQCCVCTSLLWCMSEQGRRCPPGSKNHIKVENVLQYGWVDHCTRQLFNDYLRQS